MTKNVVYFAVNFVQMSPYKLNHPSQIRVKRNNYKNHIELLSNEKTLVV